MPAPAVRRAVVHPFVPFRHKDHGAGLDRERAVAVRDVIVVRHVLARAFDADGERVLHFARIRRLRQGALVHRHHMAVQKPVFALSFGNDVPAVAVRLSVVHPALAGGFKGNGAFFHRKGAVCDLLGVVGRDVDEQFLSVDRNRFFKEKSKRIFDRPRRRDRCLHRQIRLVVDVHAVVFRKRRIGGDRESLRLERLAVVHLFGAVRCDRNGALFDEKRPLHRAERVGRRYVLSVFVKDADLRPLRNIRLRL